MRAIELNAIITGISAKVDGSLSLRVGTPELGIDEKIVVMSLQNLNVKMTVEPEKYDEKVTVEKSLDLKSESERLRNTIFGYYKQVNPQEDFTAFYKRNMEHLIDLYKSKVHNLQGN